jgi:competence protein ComEA
MNESSFTFPLRRADQALVGALVLCALVAMATYWFSKGGHRGQLVEIDQAERLPASFSVDINTASWPELAQLPDIGETLARRIVQSRNQDGPFQTHEEIQRVRGIGPVLLNRIRPYLLPIDGAAEGKNDR